MFDTEKSSYSYITLTRLSRNSEILHKETLGVKMPDGSLQTRFLFPSPDGTKTQYLSVLHSKGSDDFSLTFYPEAVVIKGNIHTRPSILQRTISLDHTHIFPVPGMGVIKIEATP
jgi:hypothetical protein